MNNRNSTLKKIFTLIGKYKPLMLISALLAVVIVALTLYVPIIIGNCIDMIIDKDNVDVSGIAKSLGIAGVLILITALAQWLMSSINNRITYHTVRDMRNNAFKKIESLPLSYIDSHPKGDIVSRVISDIDQFADGLLLGFTQLFSGVLTIIGTLVFMIAINWKIALVVVILTPISLLVAKFIGSSTHNMFKARSKANGTATAIIDEVIGNQKVVVAFAEESEMTAKYNAANASLEKASLKAIFFSSLVNPTTRFVNNVVYAAVALAGAFTAIMTAGSSIPFTIGQLSCLLSYTNQYTKPFNEISGIITEFQNAIACAARVFELTEAESETPDKENALILEKANGDIEIKDVSFSYSPDKKLIEDLNLYVSSGKRVAIVGPTGCGKTTIINLLMRFYDVDRGYISVDGTDVRNITRHSLRKNYGMVLQETWITHGTVAQNIAMGMPGATKEEIINAAKRAHAHSFIKRLPEGYETVITDGGGALSQGQRQLLCIARIMLSLPPMLILDEATSSIDTRTEQKIQQATPAQSKTHG